MSMDDNKDNQAKSDEALKKAEASLEVEQDARIAKAKSEKDTKPDESKQSEKHLNQDG